MENRGGTPSKSEDHGHILRILVWAASGLGFMGLLIVVVVLLVVSIPTWSPDFPELVPPGAVGRSAGLLAASVAAAALMGAGAVGAVGILRQRSTERTHHLERQRHDLEQSRHALEQARHDAEIVSRLRDRYAKAAEQLGHDNAAVRLAGVYATAGLADDWIARDQRDEAQICIDLLCAYQRVPRPAADTEEAARADLEVRQTITRVITGHLQDPDDDASWCGMDFDFTGATFDGEHSFIGAHFTDGTVRFSDARFDGGTVVFSEVHFDGGTVYFHEAHFAGSYVSFMQAHFLGSTVDFRGAHFKGGAVDFTEADFKGGTVDFRAFFTGGTVHFRMAHFDGSTVYFRWAHFAGGTVSFGAHFDDGTVSFFSAHFTGGTVDFGKARFTGRTVHFNRAHFTRGTVDFRRARFLGGAVNLSGAEGHADGPWGEHMPTGWPPDDGSTSAEPRDAEVDDDVQPT